MNRKSVLIAAGILVALGGVSAVAAVGGRGYGFGRGMWGSDGGRGQNSGVMLKRLDADKDGSVTLDEFLKSRQEAYEALDADKNGVVNADEIVAPAKEGGAFRLKRLMKRMDQNGDGKITKEEFEKGPKERFVDRDLNDDGKITAGDLPPRQPGKGGWHNGWRGRDKQQGGGELSQEDLLARIGERFKKRDTNADGVLDQAELAAGQAEQLDYQKKSAMHRLDKDRDGKVTRDEFIKKARDRFAALDLDNDGKITAEDLPPRVRGFWGRKDGAGEQKAR